MEWEDVLEFIIGFRVVTLDFLYHCVDTHTVSKLCSLPSSESAFVKVSHWPCVLRTTFLSLLLYCRTERGTAISESSLVSPRCMFQNTRVEESAPTVTSPPGLSLQFLLLRQHILSFFPKSTRKSVSLLSHAIKKI